VSLSREIHSHLELRRQRCERIVPLPNRPEDKELNSRKGFQNIIGQTKVDELMMFWLSVVPIRR
jgi:hypothetical protein